MEVDFESDVVWIPGEGAAIRERDRLEERVRRDDKRRARGPMGNICGNIS